MAYHHALSTHSSHTCQQLFTEAFYIYSAWLYSLAKGTCSGWSSREICASRSSLQPVAYGGQMINGVLVLFQLMLDALGLQLCFIVTSLASKCIIWMDILSSCITLIMVLCYVEKEQFWKAKQGGNPNSVSHLSKSEATQYCWWDITPITY